MSKNDFGLDASDWENCTLRTASLQFFLANTNRAAQRVLPFVGASGAVPGSTPRSARKLLVLWNPMSAV